VLPWVNIIYHKEIFVGVKRSVLIDALFYGIYHDFAPVMNRNRPTALRIKKYVSKYSGRKAR
jgi:hypothetical protein